jgi:hypothetical protein
MDWAPKRLPVASRLTRRRSLRSNSLPQSLKSGAPKERCTLNPAKADQPRCKCAECTHRAGSSVALAPRSPFLDGNAVRIFRRHQRHLIGNAYHNRNSRRAGSTTRAGTQARSAQLWSPHTSRQRDTPSAVASTGKMRLSTDLPDSRRWIVHATTPAAVASS